LADTLEPLCFQRCAQSFNPVSTARAIDVQASG